MHHRQRQRLRREGEHHRRPGARRPARPAPRPCPARGSGSASPCRPRGRTARARGRACRRPGTRSLPSPQAPAARSRARSTSVAATSIATTVRAAPRRLDGQRAGAAAGIQQPLAVQVGGQPVQQGAAHLVAPGAHGGADAADRRVRGQPLPGLRRGAVEVGLDLPAALLIGRGASSVESQQVENIAVLQRRRGHRLGAGPQRRGQPQIFLLHRRHFRRSLPSRTASPSSAASGAPRRDSGICASVFSPTASLYLSIWSVASLRLAITPPSRTS